MEKLLSLRYNCVFPCGFVWAIVLFPNTLSDFVAQKKAKCSGLSPDCAYMRSLVRSMGISHMANCGFHGDPVQFRCVPLLSGI